MYMQALMKSSLISFAKVILLSRKMVRKLCVYVLIIFRLNMVSEYVLIVFRLNMVSEYAIKKLMFYLLVLKAKHRK